MYFVVYVLFNGNLTKPAGTIVDPTCLVADPTYLFRSLVALGIALCLKTKNSAVLPVLRDHLHTLRTYLH